MQIAPIQTALVVALALAPRDSANAEVLKILDLRTNAATRAAPAALLALVLKGSASVEEVRRVKRRETSAVTPNAPVVHLVPVLTGSASAEVLRSSLTPNAPTLAAPVAIRVHVLLEGVTVDKSRVC